jgi:transcriptional regulator with XRE-family HTH domain
MPMDQRPISYLRPLRRRWGLTQKELAFLIGAKTYVTVSKLESLTRAPDFTAAFAISVIFDVAPAEVFPTFLADLHEAVYRRATDLYEEIQGSPSRVTRTKLDFLEEVMARAKGDTETKV